VPGTYSSEWVAGLFLCEPAAAGPLTQLLSVDVVVCPTPGALDAARSWRAGESGQSKVIMDGWKSLLTSRKVLLAALGVVNTLVLHYLKVDPDVWLAIDGLLVTVIAGIAIEDHGANSAGSNQAISGETVNVTNTPKASTGDTAPTV